MSIQVEREESSDFFISYNHRDAKWATWVADVLQEAGYTTIVQARDFRPGDNFVSLMHQAARSAKHTLALLSPSYLQSGFAEAEWTAAFTRERKGAKRALIPILVERCHVEGLLSPIIYINLVDCEEEEARSRLLDGVKQDIDTRLFGTPFPGAHLPWETTGIFPGQLPSIWNLQSSTGLYFTGRDEILTSLHHRFAKRGLGTIIQAITGLGGIGKTRLAVEYACRYAGQFDVVWLVRSEHPASLSVDLAALAEELGLTDEQDTAKAVKEVRKWFRRNGRWLLIFDNVEDVGRVKEFLPDGPGCILITSRSSHWGQAAEVLELDAFTRRESISFLARRVDGEPLQLESLASALGDLPLALEQAASFLEQTRLGIDGYLDLLCHRSSELLQEAVPSDYDRTVATTWEISFEQVERESAAAGQLLKLCAFLAPDDIPLELFASTGLPPPLGDVKDDPLAMAKTLRVLSRYSLARVTADSLSIHRLVQTVLRKIKLEPNEAAVWIQHAVDLVRNSFPAASGDIIRSWPVCTRLSPHALMVSQHAAEANISAEWSSWLLDRVATYVQSLGDLVEARRLGEQALRMTEHAFGPNHELVANRLNNLGGTLFQLDELDKARQMLERALAIDTARWGPDHPELATHLANLGAVVYFMGEEELGRAHMLRAVELADPSDESFTRVVSNYANELRDTGHLDDARQMIEAILPMDEARFGHDHPWVAADLEDLARIAEAEMRWNDARNYWEEALRIVETALGLQHPTVFTRQSAVALFLVTQGDLAAAERITNTALAWTTVNGETVQLPDDRKIPEWQITSSLNDLGLVLRYLGRYQEALPLFRFCLEFDEDRHGPDAPQVALSANNLGITLRDLKRVDEARSLLERSVRLANPTSDLSYPISLANLALVLADQSEQTSTDNLARQALTFAESAGRPDLFASILDKIGRAYCILGDRVLARRYIEECLRVGETVFHPKHPLLSSARAVLERLSL
ncbi:MAG: FxSxx-COOH system tetratricopeptide repeat protein [Acidobacteriota bacterium]